MTDKAGSSFHLESGERLELLTFKVGGRQKFGINVLKVKEIIPCPSLTSVPQSHPAVLGVTHLRGHTLTIIDLAQAIGRTPLRDTACKSSGGSVIVTEFSRKMQGFLVESVDRIAYCEWKNVLPPPAGAGSRSYITGVTEIEGELLEIIDVEKVLGEVVGLEASMVDTGELSPEALEVIKGKRVLVVDDSSLALNQTRRTLEMLGLECLTARDGKEALDILNDLAASGAVNIDLVVSDIEMPELDGYTLTREIRGNAALQGLYILLHTSLTGAINTEMAAEAGANACLTKFDPDDLAKAAVNGLS